MQSDSPLVGVVMGSDSDWPVMKAAAEALDEFEVPYEADVVSAHRMPREMIAYGAEAADRDRFGERGDRHARPGPHRQQCRPSGEAVGVSSPRRYHIDPDSTRRQRFCHALSHVDDRRVSRPHLW